MKEIRYSDVVPPMPEHFRRAMGSALAGLDARRRRRLPVSLAIALAAMLALSGIAYAAVQFGILDLIFTDAAPGDNAQQAVRHVGRSAKGEYADFTVHDYILSGRELYADWMLQMHTDERLVLVSTGMKADFDEDYFSDQVIPGSMALNNPFTDTFAGGSWMSMNRGYFYDEAPAEPFEMTMELALVRPDPEAVMVGTAQECSYRDQPVWVYDDEGVYWSYGHYYGDYGDGTETESDNGKIYEELDRRAAEAGYHRAWLEHLEEYGYGEVVEELSVTFTVLPEDYPVMGLAEPQRFELEDFVLTVNAAEFNGFSAKINLSLELPMERGDFMPNIRVLADGEALELAAMMESSAEARSLNYDLWSEGGCALLPHELTLIVDDTGERMTLKLSEK